MGDSRSIREHQERPEDSPTAWFAVLESALRQGDFSTAALAQQKLQGMGVDVHFRKNAIGINGRNQVVPA